MFENQRYDIGVVIMYFRDVESNEMVYGKI